VNYTQLETSPVNISALAKGCLGTSADARLPEAGFHSYSVINNPYEIITVNTMHYSYELFINLSLYGFLVSKPCSK